jgi:outer membrane protein OmpA-like peptidoglycan-associated protein
MIRPSSLSQSCLIASLALVAGLLCAIPSAYASRQTRVEVLLWQTGQTIAVPVGDELVVSLPLLHYEDDYWYIARNSGGDLKLVGSPVEKRPRNWTPWGYSRQEFHFRRVSPGTTHLVLERAYWSKPMVLKVIDGPYPSLTYTRNQPPPPPVIEPATQQKLVLRGIHFDFDQSKIRPGDAAVLDEDVSILTANPNVTVEVNGYCDATGSQDYNLKLSQRRADAVLDYLSNQGIRESRLIPHGYGKTNFVATNGTAEGRAENRRVELVPNEQAGR